MKACERAANIALAGLTLAPLVTSVNPNLNVILTACLTVYVGCYRSVKSTPPSGDGNLREGICVFGKETMSNEHAMRFPLVGSAVLLSLFLLFKFVSKDLVNTVLTGYFFVLGILALSATILPATKHFLPDNWNDKLIILRLPYFTSASFEFTKSQAVASIPGIFFCIWYASKKHWLANNILGIAFSIQGIEMLSLGSFKTGGILLIAEDHVIFQCHTIGSHVRELSHMFVLFFYDIFWVFSLQLWSVLQNLLMHLSSSAFSMLGLGDIVIPGIFVALALRFDVSRGKENRYFNSAFLGYTVGLILTIIVMNWFQAAQPALLYIVPGVIGFMAVHCICKGEVKPLLAYDESKLTEEASSSSTPTDGDSKDTKVE